MTNRVLIVDDDKKLQKLPKEDLIIQGDEVRRVKIVRIKIQLPIERF
jgi:hypothetical protein